MDVERFEAWKRAPYSREELAQALLKGRIAGPVTSHDRGNVRWKIRVMTGGDPVGQFGLTGVSGYPPDEVLAMVAREAGFDPNPVLREDPVPIDPLRVLDALEAAGRRLAQAADRGERVIVATGHPVGLILLYVSVAELLTDTGAKLLTPLDGARWRNHGRRRQIAYVRGVAVLTDGRSRRHTHSPDAMERMLDDQRPDLVFADHGFAGAAIEAGVDTVCIADINDPALVVAKNQGRAETVVVMDDNVPPENYWACFQMIASQFS